MSDEDIIIASAAFVFTSLVSRVKKKNFIKDVGGNVQFLKVEVVIMVMTY